MSTASRRQSKRCRRLLRAVLAILLLVVAWYGVGRALSPWRALRVVDAGAGVVDAVARDTQGLRVVAYNIAHGRGTGDSNWSDDALRGKRLQDIAALLRELDADVVVLNEVDFSSIWSGHVNQAALIAEAAGYRYRAEQVNIDVSLPLASLRFGNAVLSRWPIVEAKVIGLPGYAGWEVMLGGKKRAVSCVIEKGDGTRLRVIGAHLETRGEESLRIKSVRRIRDALPGDDLPVVIAGDMNTTLPGLPGATLFAGRMTGVSLLLDDGLFTAAPEGETDHVFAPTFPSWSPRRTIDWVLVGEPFVVMNLEVCESDLSDHLPVIADIRLRGADGE